MHATDLPHGVQLPRHLDEADARALVEALAREYGWAYTLHGRTDVEAHLAANNAITNHNQKWRHLTADEWSRVRHTAAWRSLATNCHSWIEHANTVPTAISQAALECASCTTALTGPPTATWGLCPSCLNAADLDRLRAQHCPAAGDAQPHRWHDAACRDCGLPSAPPAPVVPIAASRAA